MIPQPKRCPNCAWAIGKADTLQLPPEESWILTVIAENIGPDMQLHATHAELSRMTRLKPVTLSKHVRSLATRPGCIKVRRSREGYHYTLDRPETAHSKPRQPRVRMPYDDDQELQILQFPKSDELQILQSSNPETAPETSKSAIPELQNLQIPLMISPLEDPLRKKEPSLRSGNARAKALTMASNANWEEAFAEFYRLYPRHVAPDRAHKAFLARMKEGIDPADIIAGVRVAIHSFANRSPDRIPYPATWLNDGAWRDVEPVMFDPALRAAGVTPEMLAKSRQQQSFPLALTGGKQ